MTTININNANTNYTITGLTNGTSYKVRMAAVNAAGTGVFTEYAYATPSAPASNDTLMLLRANSNWGPTDEGPNNYYFHNLAAYDAGQLLNNPAELANSNEGEPLLTSQTYGGSAISGAFSSSPLINNASNSYGYGTPTNFTSLRKSDAQNLLSQMNGDFTIELWLSYASLTNPITDPIQGLIMNGGGQETYLRIGPIEFGTAMSWFFDSNYSVVLLGAKTYVGDASNGIYLTPTYITDPETGSSLMNFDISDNSTKIITTSNNQNLYQRTFSNSINFPANWASNYIHIAIVRDTTGSTYSDELRFYMDGTLIGTADLTSNGWNWNATKMSNTFDIVGIYGAAYNTYVPGINYDDIRISNTVKYSGSTITVPSSALSGARSLASANTELLLHCDSGPADYGVNKYYFTLSRPYMIYLSTVPSVTSDTTVKKFGSASYSFNSSSSQYGFISSEYYFGSMIDNLLSKLETADQYTIEMWIRPTGTMGVNGEVYLSIGSLDGWNGYQLVLMDSTNGPFQGASGEYYNNYYSSGLRLVWVDNFYNETNFARNQYSISTSSLARNVWSHVAIVYNNGSWRLKVNGADSGNSIPSTSLANLLPFAFNSTNYMANHIVLGAHVNKNIYNIIPHIGTFNGNIDEIRFSSVDRYGSGSYTVPTAAFS